MVYILYLSVFAFTFASAYYIDYEDYDGLDHFYGDGGCWTYDYTWWWTYG